MDVIVAFPMTQRKKNAIMLVVNKFSKMVYFIPHHKPMVLSILLSSTSKRSLGYMVCQKRLFLIGTQTFHPTFIGVYISYLALNSYLV